MRLLTIPVMALFLVTTSACSHKPLKAPCEAGEGKPLSMIGSILEMILPMAAGLDPCGPLKRLD